VHEATGNATDFDDIRVASLQLRVIRCSHTAVGNEDWRRSSVFYTYITHEGKNNKLMIDGVVVRTSLPRRLLRRWVSRLNHIPTHTT